MATKATKKNTDTEIGQTRVAKEALKEMLIKAYLPSDKIETELVHDRDRSIIRLNVISDEPQHLIGRQGENLFAIQQLLRLIVRKQFGKDHTSIVVDIDNYRRQQEENAIDMARSAIRRLMSSGHEQSLPPMPAYKRRAIHALIADDSDLANITTESVGIGPERRVVLKLKKK